MNGPLRCRELNNIQQVADHVQNVVFVDSHKPTASPTPTTFQRHQAVGLVGNNNGLTQSMLSFSTPPQMTPDVAGIILTLETSGFK